MIRPTILAAALLLGLVVDAGNGFALSVLTEHKALKLSGRGAPEQWRGALRVGADAALADAPSPECPAVSTFELGLFTVATNGVERNPRVTLDCTLWRATKRGWVYEDPALPEGIRKIVYGRGGLARPSDVAGCRWTVCSALATRPMW